MQRRTLLSMIAVGAGLLLAGINPLAAWAQDSDAAAVVSRFAEKGIADVLQANIPKDQKSERFRALFKQFFDIPAVARFTTGRFWKTGQPDEQTKFQAAFEDVIVYTWTRRFSEYNGQTLKVQSSAPDGDDGAIVNSTIVGNDTRPVNVAWRLRKRPEGWKVVDVIIEGVSMAVTYRQEYATVIAQQGGFAGLVSQVQNQAADLARQAKSS